MRNRRIHRICVICDRFGTGGRNRLSGFLRYAAKNPEWSLSVHALGTPNSEENLRALLAAQQPDHLAVLSCDEPTANIIFDRQRTGQVRGQTMAVDLNPAFDAKVRRVLDVRLDSAAIARESMKLLTRCGYANFAYVGYRPELSLSEERREAVMRLAQADGFPFFATDDADDIGRLADWLKDLPKPCGVVTYYDIRSRDVLDACRLAHIDVPQQIGIIGSDDDPGICEATSPTLTSVLPDFENGTYLAAAAFDRIIRGRKPRKTPKKMSYGVKSISERESSIDFSGGGLLVSTARKYIQQHAASRAVTLQEVADHCRVSRRLLEVRFRQILNRTVHDEIEASRLDSVCTMLCETKLTIGDIVRKTGFSSLSYLCALFRRKFGCTMRDYRAQNRFSN